MGFTLQQVAEHNTASSCWVIIKDRVYDVTDFLPEHPGGAQIILKYAGKDATLAYEPIHPPDALERNLPPSKHLGTLNSDVALHMEEQRANRKKTKDELRVEQAHRERPPLNRILSLSDMEDVARHTLSLKAISYYSSAADDSISREENALAFGRFFFNARVMRPVLHCDPSTTILGYKSSIPVFVSGAALAKLGHPLGEVNITRAAHEASIIQMVSSNASLSYAEIAAAAGPSQPLFFQFYKSNDDATAEQRVREVEKLGYKSIWLTVDAIVAGKREIDIKSPWELETMENGKPTYHADTDTLELVDETGTAGALIAKDDQNMTWEKTIPWLRGVTKLPIAIKGIQCVEDVILAADAGVDGILLSNHGGRQLDYSMPPLEVLYRLRQRRPDVFDKLEVYIDGGIRRGTDVVKALCLGAKAVGLGRPFLYAQSAYGEIGVLKILKILEKEIVTAMKLVGAANVKDLTPDLVERVDWQPLVRSRL
ncbi:FMN-dependent dehydrogenase-domain-containing protein [Desarmillaria tabescens]|uniref:L-lactate dehydrogenase (cytochrome) n=1 Tax=Armillaria tabescens TaxID=1929756 RepID=A0AA39NGS3_ARMTA|nr:FMN-dependent dehydrogenase-domain-containing protein [Desarmillaria tabescens]KAK0465173.1 FMN-dependent dehydrogenase-domain-containing protein [Desarmillaria tabescens]